MQRNDPTLKENIFLKSQIEFNDIKVVPLIREMSINELIPTTKGNDLRESSGKAWLQSYNKSTAPPSTAQKL